MSGPGFGAVAASDARRRRARRTRVVLARVAWAEIGLALALAVGLPAGRESRTVPVRVGTTIVLIPSTGPTVAAALAAARVAPYRGVLRSVATGTVLDPDHAPAALWVDGRRATLATVLRPHNVVRVVNGHDSVEPVDVRQVEVPPPGTPEVIHRLYQPGLAGVDEVTVGSLSGEVLIRRTIVEPRPAAPVTDNVVALTFDDGPHPTWTPAVLQVLRDQDVRATFCIVGWQARRFPELVRQVSAEGHTLCNHSEHHILRLDREDPQRQQNEVFGGANALVEIAGTEASLFRPAGGAHSPELIAVARSRGQRLLHWSIDAGDYRLGAPPVVRDRILAQLSPGAIITLHDGGGNQAGTLSMLPELIQQIRARGYAFAVPPP